MPMYLYAGVEAGPRLTGLMKQDEKSGEDENWSTRAANLMVPLLQMKQVTLKNVILQGL